MVVVLTVESADANLPMLEILVASMAVVVWIGRSLCALISSELA
jgi:hypothetical protein